MSKKITTSVLYLLVVLAVAVGIIVFFTQKPTQDTGPNPQPITLEEAQTTNIDTSDWKTYRSEDGKLEFRYPERMNDFLEYEPYDPKTNVVFEAPLVFELGTTSAVSFSGPYLPSDLGERVGGLENEGSLQIHILLFDENISTQKLIDETLSDKIVPGVATLTTFDQDLNIKDVIENDAATIDPYLYEAYLIELDNGKSVYIYSRSEARAGVDEGVNWEFARRTVSKMIETIETK